MRGNLRALVSMSVCAALAAFGLGVAAAPAQAAVVTPFSIRYQINAPGAISTVGNATSTCSTDPARYPAGSSIAGNAAKCDAARNSTSMTGPKPPSPTNNSFFMTYIDVDNDPSTFNSSSSELSLPVGAAVRFAGLYWSGYRTRGDNGGVAAPDSAASTSVQLGFAGGPYTPISGAYIAQDPGSSRSYSAFADVTTLVRNWGQGTYTVGNVQSATGSDTYGGWSLVVVYEDSSQPMRNLTVFDGWARVAGSAGDSLVEFSVSGFRTPSTGPVNTLMSLVSFEGDRTNTGVSFSVKGNTQSAFTQLTNAVNPPSDIANSTVSVDGVLQNNPTAGRYPNTLGVDVDQFAASSTLLRNGETSATMRATTSGETWFPNVVTFAVDVYAPKLELLKSQVNVSSGIRGANPIPGDVLEYAVSVDNSQGKDTALNTSMIDPIPVGTTYVSDSASLARGPCAPGGDSGSSVSVNEGTVTAYLGSGATPTAGGALPPGCDGTAYTITYRVTVNEPETEGQEIVNTATSFATGLDTGNSFSTTSNAVTAIVGRVADITIAKSTAVGTVTAGLQRTWRLSVSNLGPSAASSPILVSDTLPSSLSYLGVEQTSSPGWSCSSAGQAVICQLPQLLPAGASAPDLFIVTSVDAGSAGLSQTNTAVATSGTIDPDTGNNTANTPFTVVSRTDLSLAKLPTSFTAGGSGVYNLVVENEGPSTYTGVVTVTDTLPAGVTYSGPSPSGWTCTAAGQTVTCETASVTLPTGDARALALPVSVASGTAASVINSATVNVPAGDPDPVNNTATTTSDVTTVSDLWVTKNITRADNGSPGIGLADAPPVFAGQSLTWFLGVGNNGPSDNAGPITVQDVLPAGVRYVPGTPPAGWSCTAATVLETLPQLVTCTRTGVLASGTQDVLALDTVVSLDAAGITLDNQASITGPNEACASGTFGACTNNTAWYTITPLRGTLQVAKNVLDGNELRTGPVVVSVNCPANAALYPERWPVTLSVAEGESNGSTGLIPLTVADTCTVTETSTGAPPPPSTDTPDITPVWAGSNWTSGTRTLPFGTSATLSAESSSGAPVTYSVGTPCRLVSGRVSAPTGTGSCALAFESDGEATVTTATGFTALYPPPPSTAACASCSAAPLSTDVVVDPANPDQADQGILVMNTYEASVPTARTTRTVLLSKVAIPLTVNGTPSTTPIARKGTTTVVSGISTKGRVSVTVRCAPSGVRTAGDLRYCTWMYNAKTGKVTVTTRGWRNVVVTVKVTSTPVGPTLTSRYKPTTWTRSWKVN